MVEGTCDNGIISGSTVGGAVKIRSDSQVGARIVGLLGDRPRRELADAVGMQPSVLSRALAGERAFNMSELVDIADFLGVRVEELLFDEQPAFVRRGAADDEVTQGAVERCSRLIDAMLQIEAVGR
jgi:transcriptional regulator with XRE-family HTH domain